MPFYTRRRTFNRRSRYGGRRTFRRRRYRPRGYRRSPMYSAFRQVRNLQRQRELKYTDGFTNSPVVLGPPASALINLSTFSQGTGGSQMVGRRVKITSVTMNFTFSNDDLSVNPAMRIIAFMWKEGVPPTPITDLFRPNAGSITQSYYKDEYTFVKKTIMDRKFTFSADRPVLQRTFRFKIPARYITTPGRYNNLYFLVLCDPQGAVNPPVSYTATWRVNFHDS